jgi:hypothetical protein
LPNGNIPDGIHKEEKGTYFCQKYTHESFIVVHIHTKCHSKRGHTSQLNVQFQISPFSINFTHSGVMFFLTVVVGTCEINPILHFEKNLTFFLFSCPD